VEVGGCEAGEADAAIGYDRALHDYRLHPVTMPPARSRSFRAPVLSSQTHCRVPAVFKKVNQWRESLSWPFLVDREADK
jgi:hypothetical protein